MYWNRTSGDILDQWQVHIEAATEAGATPMLDAGFSNICTSTGPALQALYTLDAQRIDVTNPVILSGGAGPLWLSLLLRPSAGERPAPSPGFTVVYAGADLATYMASVAIQRSKTQPIPLDDTLPDEFRRAFAPKTQPGAPTPWEALPFVEVGERAQPPVGGAPALVDASADWIAWGAMLLAVALLILAIAV